MIKNNQKQCTVCEEFKDFLEFHKSKRGEKGIGSWCKICKKEHKRTKEKDGITTCKFCYKSWRTRE